MAKTKIPGEYLKDSVVRFTAKAGENITKGQSVYISGISGEVPVVSLADADDTNKMPAFGLAESTVSTNGSIEVTSNGTLAGIDTSSYALGDILYISTTAGSLTNDPSGLEASKVQNIGMVQRVHASNGSIKVGGAGRTNATPNLNDGNIFVGNSSNKSVSDAFTDVLNDQAGINSSANATAITIDSSENVGIGTSSPDSILHVNRNTNTANNLDSLGFDVVANIGNAGSNPGNHLSSGLRIFQGSGTVGTGLGVFYIGADNGTAAATNDFTGQLVAPSGMTGGIKLNAADSSGTLRFETATTERMRINSSGQLLLGTTTSDSILSVDIQNTSPSSSNTLVRIKNTIGSEDAGLIIDGNNSGQHEYRIGVNTTANTSDLTFSGGTGYRFYTGSTERMRIDTSGNLLVGNTVVNPASGFASQKGFGYAASTGKVEIATDANAAVMELGKNNSNDGSLLVFRKQGNVVGSIGVNSNDMYIASIGTYSCGLMFEGSSGARDIRPCSSTGALLDGSVDLGDSTARFNDLYLGGGVHLGGTGSANKLDDYEEGTFTPLFYGSSSGTAENSSSGYYTKIGRLVTVQVDVYNKTFGTYSGDLRMTLPFTVHDRPASGGDVYFYPNSAWDGVSNFVGFSPSAYNTAYLTFTLITNDSDRQTNISSSNTSTSGASGIFLRFSFTYTTDS